MTLYPRLVEQVGAVFFDKTYFVDRKRRDQMDRAADQLEELAMLDHATGILASTAGQSPFRTQSQGKQHA